MTPKEPKKTLRILHIDDDRNFAETTAFLLGDEYEVEFWESTIGALDKIEASDPDAILLDLEMPGHYATQRKEEGISFLKLLKESKYRSIPVFMVTENANRDTKWRCLQMGADGYFIKPLDITEINTAIRQFTDKKNT